jgi:hypothetical protein
MMHAFRLVCLLTSPDHPGSVRLLLRLVNQSLKIIPLLREKKKNTEQPPSSG